jgi:aminopeptidase N
VIGLDPDVFQRVGATPIDFETYDLVAHEFVHGYATPLIDRASPGAALLLEGFPSYFHVPSVTDVLGDAYHEWFFRRAWLSYREGLRQQTQAVGELSLPADKPLLDIKIAEIPYYKDRFLLSDKFPILLDQLRNRMGSEVFLEACRGFFAEGCRRPVAIADFFRFLEIYSGQDLSHFVARWFDSSRPLPDSWEESPQVD